MLAKSTLITFMLKPIIFSFRLHTNIPVTFPTETTSCFRIRSSFNVKSSSIVPNVLCCFHKCTFDGLGTSVFDIYASNFTSQKHALLRYLKSSVFNDYII